ncbi:ATP synthase subunit delta, chloroplastic [Cryptomeria japonica]|uniref:ATP synthase subunit delta, chloroplastic n=1 Tax=Cryptomeria japonica TaxID=3369 RepID=UPI0027DA663D|nr:ATP synthase subunit delta, chloroplastic [Cryptomeria japonica]
METLAQSSLGVHPGPSLRGLQTKEHLKQLPFAHVVPGSRSSSPFARAHCSISRSGVGIAPKSSFTNDALKALRTRSTGSQQRPVVVKQDSAAAGYAAALLDIGQSNNTLEVINRDMEKLSHLLKNQEVYDFLINPVIGNRKKKSILKAIADDAKFQSYTLNFLSLLVDKQRMNIVKDILKEFESVYNEMTDTQVATVFSALKLEHYQFARIAKKIKNLTGAQNVKLQSIIDPSLIAGFVIRFGKDASQMIDMSVKGQFENLSAQFVGAEKAAAF